MFERRGLLVAATVAAVGTLAALVALDRSAAAQWDSECAEPNQVYSETNMPTALNLISTDVVLFESGTYTGTVGTQTGATICVDGPANFNPANFNGSARLFVRGTALMPALAIDAEAFLENEGTVRFLAQINVNGLATAINHPGATIIVDSPGISLSAGATVQNDGTITVNGSVNLNGSTVTNSSTGDLTITGTLTMSGSLSNAGQMTVGGQFTVNGGGQLSSACSLTAAGLINNDDVTNSGVVQLGAAAFTNNGGASFTQTSGAITVGGDFTNNASVAGTGAYLFGGNTLNQGSVTGISSAEPIVFFDTTSTSGQIFDTNNGTVSNVVRQPVDPPDPGACSVTPPTTTTTSTTTTTTTLPPTTTTTTTTTLPPTTTTTTTSTTTTLPPTTTTTTTTTLPPTTTTTEPPTTTSTTTSTTTEPSTTTTTLPPTTTEPSTTTSTSSTTSTTTPGSVSPGTGASTTSTTSPTSTRPTPPTTDPDPPYNGTLPSTGGRPVGNSLAIALACTLAGLALTYVARPRRR